jgi:hypothetical protein
MKFAAMCTLLVSVSLGLAACNKVKSPDDVQANVAKQPAKPPRTTPKLMTEEASRGPGI